jgi:hypothetical protein
MQYLIVNQGISMPSTYAKVYHSMSRNEEYSAPIMAVNPFRPHEEYRAWGRLTVRLFGGKYWSVSVRKWGLDRKRTSDPEIEDTFNPALDWPSESLMMMVGRMIERLEE